MEPVLNKQEHKKLTFATVTDCAVRNKSYFHFVATDEDTDENEDTFSRYEIGIYLDGKEGSRCSCSVLKGYDNLFVGATGTEESNEVVVVDYAGLVYARGGEGVKKKERKIPKEIVSNTVERIRMIGGKLYVAGSHNTVCYRAGVNKWESLGLKTHFPEKRSFGFDSERYRIVDIDGTAPDNLYAISRKEFVWHYDGIEWVKMQLPSTMYLDCICCTGNGDIYISGMKGAIFKKCDDKWQQIHGANLDLPFTDMVWHAGKVWCTSRYGLWTIENDILQQVPLEGDLRFCTGTLSAADGVLLMAGETAAAYHDGNEWRLLFNII